MKKNRQIYYDAKSDSLYLLIKDGVEESVVETAPGVNVEMNKKGEVIGVEVLKASESIGRLFNGKGVRQRARFASVAS